MTLGNARSAVKAGTLKTQNNLVSWVTTVRLSIEQIQLVIWRRIVVVVVNVLKGAEKLDFLERVEG